MLKPTESSLTFHIKEAQVFYCEDDVSINICGDDDGCEQTICIQGVTANRVFMFIRNCICAGEHITSSIAKTKLTYSMAEEMIEVLQQFVETNKKK